MNLSGRTTLSRLALLLRNEKNGLGCFISHLSVVYSSRVDRTAGSFFLFYYATFFFFSLGSRHIMWRSRDDPCMGFCIQRRRPVMDGWIAGSLDGYFISFFSSSFLSHSKKNSGNFVLTIMMNHDSARLTRDILGFSLSLSFDLSESIKYTSLLSVQFSPLDVCS